MVKNAGEPGEVGQLPGMPNFDPRSGTAPGGDTYGRPGGADVGTALANNGDPYKSSQQPTQSLSVESGGTAATQMMTDLVSGVDQTGPGQTATAGDQSSHVFGAPHHNSANGRGPGL